MRRWNGEEAFKIISLVFEDAGRDDGPIMVMMPSSSSTSRWVIVRPEMSESSEPARRTSNRDY
jgi:hypothetical protein